jgi:tripartite ATP-independent transporter DctM subunit
MNSFVLLAVPLFILAGEIINKGKISKKILMLANVFVGRYRGGLGYANVLASMLFGGLTGSALADVAALGPIEIDMMTKHGYDKEFSTAVTAASALQGPIIPPSIPAVLIASVTGISVGGLFIGSAIPGIMVGLGAMFVVYIISVRRNYPVEKKRYTLKEILNIFLSAIPALFTIVIILGGIVGGIFTPTEAAAVAVIYVIILSLVGKNLDINNFVIALTSTLKTTAKLFMIIGFATVFSWIIAIENVPEIISNFLLSVSSNKYVIILLINLIILFWGMWMDTAPSIVILIPLFLPIAKEIGIHPIHFGVIMIVNLMIGQISPPFGMTLYTAQAVGKVEFSGLIKDIIPFVLIDIVVLIMITYIPAISLWLPSVFNFL